MLKDKKKCILLSETECHIINNLLTELARAELGNIGPRPTTSSQYSPVRPSRSVSKGLVWSQASDVSKLFINYAIISMSDLTHRL